MKTLGKIREYILKLRKYNWEEPKDIPLSKIEVVDIMTEPVMSFPIRDDTPSANKIFGVDIFDTPFAEPMRQKRVNMSMTQFVYEYSLTECMLHQVSIRRNNIVEQMKHKVVSDTSKLNVTFEWDCWAVIKRKLHITKWFPVKSRQVTIDCVALYPYIKITLPHNKHYVQFRECK